MNPTTIIIDVDGVLTDNRMYFSESGERTKGFHSRDTEAIRELIANGYSVHLLTSSSWPGIHHYAKRTGAIVAIERDKLSYAVALSPYIAIGDSGLDMPMLHHAAKAFCPLDAAQSVREMPGVVTLHCKGGEGVVSELVRVLCYKKVNDELINHAAQVCNKK